MIRTLKPLAIALAATALFAPLSHAQAPAQAQKLEEVNYLLPAPPTLPAFGPWVLAQQRGYYAREGLKVNFLVGKGGVDVAKQVGAGNAPIGGGIGDTPIIARAQGVPVKAVALIGSRALHHLHVLENQGINRIADLKGKTITVMSYQDTSYYVLLGVLASAGLTKNDVDVQAAGPVGVWQQAAAGKAQAFAGPVDFAISARGAGAKVRTLASDQYVKTTTQAILASDEMIAKRPDLIQKLVRATLAGLTDMMKDPKGAVPDFIAGSPSFKGKEAFLEDVFRQYNEFTYQGGGALGATDPEKLAAMQKFYVSQGIVQKEVPVSELYTNQFVGR
jgi:NitT/TauT family transport system substrate-binding protein